jgi:hypothetical protein
MQRKVQVNAYPKEVLYVGLYVLIRKSTDVFN